MSTDTLAQQVQALNQKIENDRAAREAARAHIDDSLAEMKKIANAISSAAGFWGQPVQGQPVQGQTQGQAQGFGIKNPNPSWLASLGLAPPWAAQKVPFTLEEGCAQLATPQPHPSVVEAAQRGLYAMGLRAAYEGGLIEAPRKGLSTGEIIGLTLLGGVALGGTVIAGMAMAKVGPFRGSDAPHGEE